MRLRLLGTAVCPPVAALVHAQPPTGSAGRPNIRVANAFGRPSQQLPRTSDKGTADVQ